MIRDAVIILLGMFALGGTAVVCMVLAVAWIDRGTNFPIPPLPAVPVWDGDIADAPPEIVEQLQDNEKRVQREVVFMEINAWYDLPAAVNR
jgi:hypothetical protein